MNPSIKYWPIILIFLLILGCGDNEGITAFTNVNLVPMTEETITANQTILVKGDQIFKIGPSNEIKIPSNAKVIDGQGAYLMPGLADMHVHLTGDWPLPQLDLYLANGVTTIRDLDGRGFMLKWQDEIRAGKRVGPTLYVAAPTIRGNEKNLPELVLKHQSGYDCTKIYSYLSTEDYQKDLNIDQSEHMSFMIDKLKSAEISVCTTLVVDDVIVKKLFEPESFLTRPQSRYLPQTYKQGFLQGREKHQIQFEGIKELVPFKYDLDKTLLIELHRAGIPLILGTDSGTGTMGIVPGFSIHDELRILVDNGLTPYEAIAAGTVNASKVAAEMTGENGFGTIEVDKRADLILVNKNPLEDVVHIKDNRGVMAAGKWYENSYLQAIISPDLLPGVAIEGNVFQARSSDNSMSTQIEIIIGENLYGPLPDAIDSITLTLTSPDGISSQVPLPHYRYLDQFRDFWYRIDGPPALGKYFFKVTGKGFNGTATDFQTANRALPLPDTTKLSPADGATLTSKTPTFSWAPVDYPDCEVYYRLVINDLAGKRIYGTARIQNMLSDTITEGLLKPGQTYQYKVRVTDNEDWVEMQNRSESQWVTFSMSEALK